MPPPKKIPPVAEGIRFNLLNDLAADRPNSEQQDGWYEVKAAEYKIPVAQVRNTIAKHLEQVELGVKIQARSTAQKVASVIGATLTEGLQVVKDSLRAKKLLIKADRNGNVVFREERPDWDARLSGAKEIFNIYGAYAPKELLVEYGISDRLADLTEADLKLRIVELARGIEADPEFNNTTNGQLETAGRGAPGGPGGAEGAESGEGLLLLADGMHENAGRATPIESVPAVPEERVLPADPERPKRRANRRPV